jgi:hypothetical protein
MIGHRNLCDHAESPHDLYKLWDDDLKRSVKRRNACELFALLSFAGAICSLTLPTTGNTRFGSPLSEGLRSTPQSRRAAAL